MPRVFKFENNSYSLPDGTSDQEAMDFISSQHETQKPLPGTEKLPGGVAPGVPKPSALPESGKLYTPEFTGDSYGAELPIPSHNFATNGADRVGSGVRSIADGKVARGTSDIIRGVGEATSPITTAMALMNPITGIRTIAGGAIGEALGRGTADLFGAGEDTKDAVGDVTGIAGGGVAASPKTVPFIKGAIQAVPRAVSDNFGAPVTLHNLMHSKLSVPAAIGTGLGYLMGHPIAGGVAGGVAGSVPAVVRGGIRAAKPYSWFPEGGMFSPAERGPKVEVMPQQKALNPGPAPIITDPPARPQADGSYVRSAPAMAHPPNPARALPPAPRVIEMPGNIAQDASHVRGVPAMTQPPNPARALPPAPRVFEMPSAPDGSYVRGVPATYPERITAAAPKPAGPISTAPPEAPLPKVDILSNAGELDAAAKPRTAYGRSSEEGQRLPQASGERPRENPRSTPPGVGVGTETAVKVPGENVSYKGRYVVRELDDVTPSHNGITFERNSKYPHENDRDYSNPVNQERVVLNSNPERFDPKYLITDNPDAANGPSIIEPDGPVLGGNNRQMIMQRVYNNNPKGAESYRNLLTEKASQFGIDPEHVKGMKKPVLYRELTDAEATPQRAITDFNKQGTAELTQAERATADARNLHPDIADYIGAAIEAEGDGATLNDALSGNSGVKILNHLVDSGVFTMQEKPKLIDSKTGAITAQAKERISKMLVGGLFRDSDQMTRIAPELRNKMERIAAPVLQSQVKEGWNLTPKVREAVDLIEYADSHGIRNLHDVVSQVGMFGDEPKFSEDAVTLANAMRKLTPTELGKRFKRYMGDSVPNMFGESTPEDAFAEHFGGESKSEAAPPVERIKAAEPDVAQLLEQSVKEYAPLRKAVNEYEAEQSAIRAARPSTIKGTRRK